uniref:Uncharacterized protein n=1 Tax=Panagrolaimus davidi TaxID=227884 RepID=A0A914PJZ4_9BILA
MNFLKQKQKISMIYNRGTKEVESCILSEASTYMYKEKSTATKSSKVIFNRYMDTADENSDSHLNDKENTPIVEIPETDESTMVEFEENVQDRKVRFASRVRSISTSRREHKKPTPDSDRRLKTILKPCNRQTNEQTEKIIVNKNETKAEPKKESPPPRKLPSPIETPKSRPRSSSLRPRRSRSSSLRRRRSNRSSESPNKCKHFNSMFVINGKCSSCGYIDENATMIQTKISPKSVLIDDMATVTNKDKNIEKPFIAKNSSSSSLEEINRTYTISPRPPTPPRILQQPNERISRQRSVTRRSNTPLYECKHRHLKDDGSCLRCKAIVKSRMFSSMTSPMETEKIFASKAECKRSSYGKNELILPWPLSEMYSRKQLAPFTLVSNTKGRAKGRFIIQKDTELIYEAVKKDEETDNYFVKYIFRVSKEGSKQVVTVSSPLKANQILCDEKSLPIRTSKPIYEFTNLQKLENYFPGYYKHICKALMIISARVPRIECRNILEIKHLYAKIMINGDFRLIFPNNNIFFHKFGTSDDAIECPKTAEYSTLTPDERNIFYKAREHLRELDTAHRKANGPNYHGIVVKTCIKSENESTINDTL